MTSTSPVILISQNRFHHRLTLPTPNGPLTVSYADIGSPTGPALLLLPGMFASRYLGIPMHVIAQRAGVRLLVVDRPGMGASSEVPLKKRVDIWVDMIPRLLSHLGIPRISLVAHSAGTVYLFNTLVTCRGVVWGDVFFLAPWVDTTHSRVTTMQIAQYIPTSAFALWNKLPRFFVTQATPVLASSGAVLRWISLPASGLGTGSTTTNDSDPRTHSFLETQYRLMERDYGVPHEEHAELVRLAVNYMFTENTVGANDEALQCLRKSEGGDWGVCGDYAACVLRVVKRERERERVATEDGSSSGRMRVRVYFSAKDALVGGRGQKYFESCWRASGVEEGVDFGCKVVEGTDHDTVMQAVGVWEEICAMVTE
ncbi:Alpha/Beta hydrolase protein [Aspergillus californicus]